MKKFNFSIGIIWVSLLSGSYPAVSQEATGQDTLQQISLRELTVYGIPREKFAIGTKVTTIDSTLLGQYPNLSLGELINRQLPINLKSYGNGMLSTVAFRGTSANHTAVLWNGININSPTAGQSDFSILPTFAFDQLTVQTGGASALYGSDAIGGSIQLNSQLSLTPGVQASLLQQAGSFRTFGTQGSITYGKGRWTGRTKGYLFQSANNFTFRNTSRFGTPVERQTHAGFHNSGFLQDILFQPDSKNRFALYTWYHSNHRNVQSTISARERNGIQDDESIRLVGEYSHKSAAGTTILKTGYLRDNLFFYNPATAEHSSSKTNRYFSRLEHEAFLGNRINVNGGAEITHYNSLVDGYSRRILENRTDVFLLLRYQLTPRWLTSLNLRQAFVTGFRPPFAPSIGSEYTLWRKPASQLIVKTALSRNYRVPTLNDRYWITGGNPALLSEDGLGGEVGLAFKRRKGKHKISAELTHYQYRVNNWIEWSPDASDHWSARNLMLVNSRGFEGTTQYTIGDSRRFTELGVTYTFTPSTQEKNYQHSGSETGKQLIYVPLHTGVVNLQSGLKNWLFSTQLQYTGKRYTSEDHQHFLPGYLLVHASLSRSFSWRQLNALLLANFNNITNANYQSLPNRAMPGRNYSISVKIDWKN